MKFFSMLCGFTLLISSTSINVLADEKIKPFIGIKGGYQVAHDDNLTKDTPKNWLLGGYGGLKFNEHWSWDIGYQSHNSLTADSTNITIKNELFESALRYDWPLNENINLYGRLGAAYWDLEKTSPLFDKIEASEYSPIGELGIGYKITNNINISAGYQYIDSLGNSKTGEYDSHSVLLSLTYLWGASAPEKPIHTKRTTSLPIKKEVIHQNVKTISLIKKRKTDNAKKKIVIQRKLQSPSYSIGREFLFEINSTIIGQNFKQQLKEIALRLVQYPQASVQLVGYADASSSALYNQRLSERRAQAVKKILLKHGVNPNQISSRGMGFDKKINKRIVIVTVLPFSYKA